MSIHPPPPATKKEIVLTVLGTLAVAIGFVVLGFML